MPDIIRRTLAKRDAEAETGTPMPEMKKPASEMTQADFTRKMPAETEAQKLAKAKRLAQLLRQ